jgi:hypothetical protein
MNRKEKIRQLDLDLAQHKGLLSEEEEQRYIDLVVECYEVPETEEGETEEPLPLELLKLHKKLQLMIRDSSTEVNGFVMGGKVRWIPPYKRANFRCAIDSMRTNGRPAVELEGITLPIEAASAALIGIEDYAAACDTITKHHAAAIDALETEEAVAAYDFTAGYPEMLNFDLLGV